MTDTPVADHAFLSDARTGALVTSQGSVDWLCLPRFDSPPAFARLLDDGGGHLLVRPADPAAVSSRRYLPQSLVLETVWTCASGRLVVRDCLALGEEERGHDLGRSSPGVLMRHLRADAGLVEVVLQWAPRPEFGLIHPRLLPIPGGLASHGGATVLVLSTGLDMTIDRATAEGRVTLEQGHEIGLAMEQFDAWDREPRTRNGRDIARSVDATYAAWQSWSELHQRYEGPLEALVHRSGLVLQGLTYARSGAIVAAPTTSLPEGVGTGRTWDYRYTWVRDASMTMRGLFVAACPDEARRFFEFLARAAGTQLGRGRHLQTMFGVGAERDLSERELPHLTGWRDSAPVRVGNDAWGQRQQDVYGALLDAAYVLRAQLGDIAESTRTLLVEAVEAAAATWQVPDQGIWEIRGPARRYLHSALMCWVALDRGVALSDTLGAADREHGWRSMRDELGRTIATEGWNEDVGAFTQCLGGDALDASSLLVGLVGLLPPDDRRVQNTIDAVVAGLTDERGLVQRYRGDDGLSAGEGSFLLCTFWLAEALAGAGRLDEAEIVLQRAASHANDLGLLAEQVDSQTGELMGNYPQAFSHLGLVLAAQALSDARRVAGTQ